MCLLKIHQHDKIIQHTNFGCYCHFISPCNNASNDSKTADTTEKKEMAFDLATAKTAIEAENTKFMDAFKKGDSAAVASNYTQDALVMPPNAEPVAKAGMHRFGDHL